MKYNKKLSFILFVLYFFPAIIFAGWPIFAIPTKEQLIHAQVFDITQCPQGFGKIKQGVILPVKTFSIGFCPSNWNWVASNNTECVEINTLEYLNHTIQYDRGDEGMIKKSIITAIYGKQGFPLFSLIFSTPEEFWSCYDVTGNPHLLTCANDI